MQGKTINGFTLQRLLGEDGVAEVWLAENAIGKKAAVKLLLPKFCANEAIVARFQNEAKVMAQLKHPNIQQVYDFGSIDGRPCIVMEYLEGADLNALMKSGRRFTEAELRLWWNQIADALNYTHAQGIVHRDIKPSNLFLDKKGNIKLLDFGIAKIRESISMTQTGATIGTLIYMSPEQVDDAKRLGPESDVYSLAVTFVHLLTGKAPYDSTTSSDFKIRESIVYKPLDLSGVPSEWQGFLAPYLAKKPEDRPVLRPFEVAAIQASSQMVASDDEGTIVNDTPKKQEPQKQEPKKTEPKPATEPKPDSGPKNKKNLWIALAAVAVAVLVAVLVMNNKGGNRDLTITVNGVSFVMKPVEGGTFQMGSNDSEAESDESPVHSVTVNSFYMGETEVTQALWKAVMGDNPSYFKGDNFPVEQVSWYDCQEFIRKLNNLTGKDFRLPTEAEWEYAARGGKKSNGYKYAGSNTIDDVAWYWKNSGDNYLSGSDDDWDLYRIVNNNCRTRMVKGKTPNELGLYDMSGNVWEWCQDWYGDYSSASQTNPQSPSNGSIRVLRGGCRSNRAELCQVSNRHGSDPGNWSDFGFRLVLPQ